jgi:ethanolamine transporter EutH
LLGLKAQPLSIAEGFRIMAAGVVHAIVTLWDAIVHAALGWIVIGPVLIFGLYRLFRPILMRAARSLMRAPGSATP